jgi:predicted PurR-regulated permease PerM
MADVSARVARGPRTLRPDTPCAQATADELRVSRRRADSTSRPSASSGLAGPAASSGYPALHGLAATAIIVAGLYFGRAVLVPFALAVLLTFLLAPVVLFLRRRGLGRVPAVVVVATLGFAVLGVTAYAVSIQILDLANQLPEYQENVRRKLQAFSGPGSGVLKRASQVLEELQSDLAASDVATGSGDRPIAVEIRRSNPTSLNLLREIAGSLLGPLSTAGIVVVLVIFMLIQREDLRDRLIGLVGTGRLHVTTRALDDAARRISRYLLMQLLINLSYGVPVGIGLYLIGVPNPLLWGLLATLLRFVPYVGPLLAMSMPLALAFAVDPGWTSFLLAWGCSPRSNSSATT